MSTKFHGGYGKFVSLSASVPCTDFKSFTRCRPRCTVRTFNSSRVAGLGALYELSILNTLPASVHCTDFQFLTRCRPRCTVRTFNPSRVAGLGALCGLSILKALPASVHCTFDNAFKGNVKLPVMGGKPQH